jgi:DME family drug/metabolite transporter
MKIEMTLAETSIRESTDRNYIKGFVLVFFTGTIWSFGALIVRYMVEAQTYQWHYLFYRGMMVTVVLLVFLMAREGVAFLSKFKRIGLSGFFGACGLVAAFSGFIWSITLTTAANTLFMLAVTPFIAAILGIVFLREKIRSATWAAMVITLVGVLVMVVEGLETGNILGILIALVSTVGFAVFSVSLRWRKETPQFTTVALAGVLCVLFTLVILFFHNETLTMPLRNVYLSMLHGFIISVGLISFSFGAKYLPAAELTLLSLIEVVGGVLWVYLPVFGIHEVPSMLTVVGGITVLCAIVLDGVGVRHQRRMIGMT